MTTFCWDMYDDYTYGMLDEIITTCCYDLDIDKYHVEIPKQIYHEWYRILWLCSPNNNDENLLDTLLNTSHEVADDYIKPYLKQLKIHSKA